MERWIQERRARRGHVTAGPWAGDRLTVELIEPPHRAWHLYLVGEGHLWDIYAEDDEQLVEWLGDPEYGFILRDE